MSDRHRPALVVLGTGMAGLKVVEEVVARTPDRFQIRMFGAEPHAGYNRILLSSVLGGDVDPARLWLHTPDWFKRHGIFVHGGIRAEGIDLSSRTVRGAGGKVVEPYDRLVVATGSRPFVPPLEGHRLEGVHVFRTLDDCDAIRRHAENAARAVVLGGGLLGLEAARGLLAFGLETHVVEAAGHLMPLQLDATAGDLLRRKLETFGLRFHLGVRASRLLGTDRVEGVELEDGRVLDTDLVVVACGVRPNVEEAKEAGLDVRRGIVVDDQLRTSDPHVHAVGECAEHAGIVAGLVDPVYDQARVLADVLAETKPDARYTGSRPSTTLKVMGVDLVSLGESQASGPDVEVLSHLDPGKGVYKKLVLRGKRLVGGILLGTTDPSGKLLRLFRSGQELEEPALDLLTGPSARDALLQQGGEPDLLARADDTQICNCNEIPKGAIVAAIRAGCTTVAQVGQATRAGTGCGTCQPLLQGLIGACTGKKAAPAKNKVEIMKEERDPLTSREDLLARAATDDWAGMTEDDKNRAKWHGLFFRKPTPGHFMLRLRFQAGRTNAAQFRVLADLSDEFGRGFTDLTTRQQIQLRWFTLGQLPEIWRRMDAVGLSSLQTGMDNVRGVVGCPVAGLTPHELLDATDVIRRFDDLILGNPEFTNLPRKFNVVITGCMENCCHTETQDIALVPAYRELNGMQVNGFNVLVGGKQGSGGYRPASPLDVFAPPDEAHEICGDIARAFRDHGSRATRNRARLAFLIDDRGAAWFRNEVEKLRGRPLLKAGTDLRKKHHVDHLGIHPQHKDHATGKTAHYVGLLVPVGRITTAQMRGVADVAERYGNGEIRITVGQNLIVPNIPEEKLASLTEEPIFKDLPFDPSPILRGLVACTGNDYCGMALIDTKGYAIDLARELERRTEGRKLKPLSMHWSGCPAGCGLHQVATIGLQGCRSRVDGKVVDAAHVCVGGKSGPNPEVATDLMYDVPIHQLADALEPLVSYLPR